MVWIHGGAHRLGAGSFPIYDGSALARQGVILVTINYRLGLLGYFAHPALTAEAAPDAPLGNYGFMDQIAALEWVRRNAAAFGGDPSNVTVFGESAGGASILNLLASPRARGLFHKAIVESGGGIGRPTSLAEVEEAGRRAAQDIGVAPTASAADLRARPAGDWLRAQGPVRELGFGPFVDGRLITDNPTRVFLTGGANDVPLMIGANSNEASVLGAMGRGPQVDALAQGEGPALRAAYGAGDDTELVRQALGDAIFVAPARFVARAQASGAPVYLYHFSYVPVVRRGRTPGAGHGSEIPYVFQSFDRIPLLNAFVRPQDAAMARTMSACWVAFARTGRPACEGAPDWPAYTLADDATMEFGTEIAVRRGFRRAQLDFIMGRMAAMGATP
jgi:para-nitrobenzyl esterase